MDKLQDLKEKRSALEARILKVLRADGVQGIDSCKKDINDLCKVSSAISVLEVDSPTGLLKLFIDEVLDSYNGDKIMVNCKLGAAIQDTAGYEFRAIKPEDHAGIAMPYPIGRYKDFDVMVDPKMKWSDSRIMFYGRGLSEMDGYKWQELTRVPAEIFDNLKF